MNTETAMMLVPVVAGIQCLSDGVITFWELGATGMLLFMMTYMCILIGTWSAQMETTHLD